jgi:hypothetical protein
MQRLIVIVALTCAVMLSPAVRAQRTPGDGPRYTNRTSLIRPTDYREWTFLSSGMDMNYNPPPGASQSGRHTFTNVFVNNSSYRSFLQAGTWSDGTIFVLEARAADNVSRYFPDNRSGLFQAALGGIEANVKDSRFEDGWAFFRFDGTATSAEPLSGEALARGQCVECHTKETAVERTFVQFYPTLLEIARQKGTLKPGF